MNPEHHWKMIFALSILIAALILVGLFWWNNSTGDPIRIQPLPVFDAVNEGEFDQAVLAEGSVGVLDSSLYLRILPPSTKEEGRTVTILPYDDPEILLRDDDPDRDIKSVCFIYINALIASSESPETGGRNLIDNNEPLCHNLNENDYFYEEYTYSWSNDATGETEGSMPLTNVYNIRFNKDQLQSYEEFNPLIVGSNFWFPYDPFGLQLRTDVLTEVELTDGTLIFQHAPAYIEFQLIPSGGRPWDIAMNNEMIEEPMDESLINVYQDTYLSFVRPLLYRISFPVIIAAMVFFIAFVPLIANPNVETILGIMASLLFATFAVRSLLSPGDQIGETIIDIAILGLYVLLILAGLLLVFRVMRFKKREERGS